MGKPEVEGSGSRGGGGGGATAAEESEFGVGQFEKSASARSSDLGGSWQSLYSVDHISASLFCQFHLCFCFLSHSSFLIVLSLLLV